MIIDAHQHFWQPERGDYGWLTPELPTLYRDFMPADLEPHLQKHGIGGTILVQAAPTIAETEFLLDIAQETSFVLGVVGWVDFTDAPDQIARLSAHPKMLGLRPMLQDIAEDDWMLRAELAPAFEAIITHDLTFDALVQPRHLPYLRRLLAQYPDLRVVIDHGAKPDIAGGDCAEWENDIAALAKETLAYCKLSGLITEASDHWVADDITPYITHLVRCFGENRLIWGSDWPVLTLAASYEQWLTIANSMIQTETAKRSVFGQNAIAAYKLDRKLLEC